MFSFDECFEKKNQYYLQEKKTKKNVNVSRYKQISINK